jgi:hypothetical protein
MDAPWAEHEKIYLLCEIMKASQPPIPSQVLFNFLRQSQVEPRWTETALPPGNFLFLRYTHPN